MTAKFTLCTALTALSLAIANPAQAAPASAEPAVEGGDMGCFIALGIVGMRAKKLAEDPKQTDEVRKSARELDALAKADADWYMARLSTWAPERRNRAVFSPLFGKYIKLDTDALFETAKTCSLAIPDRKSEMLDTLQK